MATTKKKAAKARASKKPTKAQARGYSAASKAANAARAARQKKADEPASRPRDPVAALLFVLGDEEFPVGPKHDAVVAQAMTITRARYYCNVANVAKDIFDEAKGSASIDDPVDERIDTLVNEAADSAVCVYSDALRIMVESDNWTVIDDEVGEDPSSWGAKGTADAITKIAYYAYRADLVDAINLRRETGV